MENRIGKIEHAEFGLGGYQDACIGLHLTFSGKGWGVGTTHSAWDANLIKHSEHTKWTEADRSKQYDEIMRKLSDVLSKAKVDSVSQLKGIPVEVTFDGNMLKDWRVLEEAL